MSRNINYGDLIGALTCGGGGSYSPSPTTEQNYGTVPISIYVYDRATKGLVPGAKVTIYGADGHPLMDGVTDTNGVANFTVPALPDAGSYGPYLPPHYNILIQKAGYDTDPFTLSGQHLDFYPAWGTSRIISTTLNPTGANIGRPHQVSIDIYAYDKDKKPISGATVAIYPTTAEQGGVILPGQGISSTTNAAGKTSLKIGVPATYGAQKWYVIKITKGGYATRTLISFGEVSEAISVGMAGTGTTATPPSTTPPSTTPPSTTPPSATPPSTQPPAETPPVNTPPNPPTTVTVGEFLKTTWGKVVIFGGGGLLLYLLMKKR